MHFLGSTQSLPRLQTAAMLVVVTPTTPLETQQKKVIDALMQRFDIGERVAAAQADVADVEAQVEPLWAECQELEKQQSELAEEKAKLDEAKGACERAIVTLPLELAKAREVNEALKAAVAEVNQATAPTVATRGRARRSRSSPLRTVTASQSGSRASPSSSVTVTTSPPETRAPATGVPSAREVTHTVAPPAWTSPTRPRSVCWPPASGKSGSAMRMPEHSRHRHGPAHAMWGPRRTPCAETTAASTIA